MKQGSPIEFLTQAQKDPKLSARVLGAVERGGRVTAEEVLEIAQEFGYSFSRAEFEREVKRDMAERFKAGDESLADVVGKKKPTRPPQSSCARGCVSWTTNWHPTLPLG
jgi:hypothetical protein